METRFYDLQMNEIDIETDIDELAENNDMFIEMKVMISKSDITLYPSSPTNFR